MKRWSLTNLTPTPTSDSDSSRVTHPRIFSHHSTSILLFEAVEPYLQRHPYTPNLHALHTLKCVTIIDLILQYYGPVYTNTTFLYVGRSSMWSIIVTHFSV